MWLACFFPGKEMKEAAEINVCMNSVVSYRCTNLLWIPQVKEVQEALVTHLLVCGEHDDVAAEIKAARSDSGVGVE